MTTPRLAIWMIAATCGSAAAADREAGLRARYASHDASMWIDALPRYESPETFDLLHADIARLAVARAWEAKHCRWAMRLPPEGGPIQPSSAYVGQKGPPPRMPQPTLVCAGGNPQSEAAQGRQEAALRLVGRTDLPGVEREIFRHLPAILREAPEDSDVAASRRTWWKAWRASHFKSVAEMAGKRGFQPMTPILLAVLRTLPGENENEFKAAWPLLKALAQLEAPEAGPLAAEWAARRAAVPLREYAEPSAAQLAAIAKRVGEVRLARQEIQEGSESCVLRTIALKDVALLRECLGRGGSPNVRAPDGRPALLVAHPEFGLQMALVEAGADVNATGPGGMTVLHQLLDGVRDTEIAVRARYWIGKGARTDAALSDGHTMLYRAIEHGRSDLAAVLLEAGADPNAATADGLRPLQLARDRRQAEIAQTLEARGGTVGYPYLLWRERWNIARTAFWVALALVTLASIALVIHGRLGGGRRKLAAGLMLAVFPLGTPLFLLVLASGAAHGSGGGGGAFAIVGITALGLALAGVGCFLAGLYRWMEAEPTIDTETTGTAS